MKCSGMRAQDIRHSEEALQPRIEVLSFLEERVDRSGLVALEEVPEEPIYSSGPEIYRPCLRIYSGAEGPRIRPGEQFRRPGR